VWLRDGRKLEATVTKPKGDPERPLTVDEIKEKYMDCCADVVESRDREESWALLERLENASRVKDLMRYFTVTL
jgi:2-methylcitrate dehydratase PrpD